MRIRSLMMKALIIVALLLNTLGVNSVGVWAQEAGEGFVGFMMSPPSQRLILEPGEVYNGSFTLINPGDNTSDVNFKLTKSGYFRDENGVAVFENIDGYGQIAQWITIDSKDEGVIRPGDSEKVYYTIVVPKDAPAGGQYAAITASSSTIGEEGEGDSATLKESIAMAYTILAEITGNTTHSGEISDLSVPSFLLSGNILGSSTIKNTGNVHDTAIYKLQVFPLFSDEEVYTSEEDPTKKNIMPGRSLYHETTWNNTPDIGIFNVVYTVEFAGVTRQASKMVIKCPIWLLFVIIFAVVALIIWVMLRAKNKGKKTRKSDD